MSYQTCAVSAGEQPTIESMLKSMMEIRRIGAMVQEPIRLTRDQFAALKQDAEAAGLLAHTQKPLCGLDHINGVRIEIVGEVENQPRRRA